MKKMLTTALASTLALCCGAADYPIRTAAKNDVRVTRGFWFDRCETNRTATLKSNWDKCNETPRVANITNAANRAIGTFGGIPFDDSDVFKVMEGSAYILAANPDPKLESYMAWLIGQVAKAQEPDGYLYTARTLGHEKLNHGKGHYHMMGPTRWSNIPSSHELYNNGHMIEAAVAWYETTGRRDFLEVAIRTADLFDRTFGPGPTQLKDAPGHEEIELALVKLYRVTREERYLRLAEHFVNMRGRRHSGKGDGRVFAQSGRLVESEEMSLPGSYNQNHLPFADQRVAVGHAVRAGYLYSGAADVAALTGDASFLAAIDALWEDVVRTKLHLSGGIGARPGGEMFGAAYELPNEGAYLETCAAIANAMWNDRMFRRTGESKYVDVLERVIYNGFPSGISLAGDEYFYPNPLASRGGYRRSKWFGCSCCPVNDVRFIPQIPALAYATDGKGTLYWNLFMEGEANICGAKLCCKTDYPWDGKIALELRELSSAQPSTPNSQLSTLKIRIPGWAKGMPVPSDLYRQTEPSSFMEVAIAVNGLALNGCPGRDGYVAVTRDWKAGDVVTVALPMPVKRIRANEKVEADRGRLAVERGPIVWCAEGCDNGGEAFRSMLPADATFADDKITIGDKTFPALKASNGLKLIPYCLWGNREPGNDMQVWFAESRAALVNGASGAFITSSCCWREDTPDALFDGKVPSSSADTSIPRFTFWDDDRARRTGEQWVQLEFDRERVVKDVEIYWFDDTGKGGCAVPAEWSVQTLVGGEWRDAAANPTVVKDAFSRAALAAPVSADKLRIKVVCSPGKSAGILEARLK